MTDLCLVWRCSLARLLSPAVATSGDWEGPVIIGLMIGILLAAAITLVVIYKIRGRRANPPAPEEPDYPRPPSDSSTTSASEFEHSSFDEEGDNDQQRQNQEQQDQQPQSSLPTYSNLNNI